MILHSTIGLARDDFTQGQFFWINLPEVWCFTVGVKTKNFLEQIS